MASTILGILVGIGCYAVASLFVPNGFGRLLVSWVIIALLFFSGILEVLK